jgi:diguanylate cyclase (GGDEF)-like protein
MRSSAQTGTFGWDNQIGRVELLAVATVLNTAIVVRSRRFWLGSMRDRLTGLFQSRLLRRELMRLVESRLRSRSPFAVAIADLDHFKSINDRFGHSGRRRGPSSRRAASSRKLFRGKDLVARYGGEEFAALLVDLDLASAAARLEAWRAAPRRRWSRASRHDQRRNRRLSGGRRDPGWA